MKYKLIAITPCDGFDLLAVWEKDGRKWHLLELARPQRAIALARENPKARLVFPTEVNPNKLRKERCQKNASRE
jgi:hypothetical protein